MCPFWRPPWKLARLSFPLWKLPAFPKVSSGTAAVGNRGQGGMGIPVTRECALHGCEALNSDIGSREKGVYFDVTAFFTPHSSVHKAATGEVRGFGSGSVNALLFPTYVGA